MACMDQVRGLFPFPLREDIVQWASIWCGAGVQPWIVAVGVSAWIEAVSEKRGTPEALKRKELMSKLQIEINGEKRSMQLRLLASRLYGGGAVKLDQWIEYRKHLEGLKQRPSDGQFITLFQVFAAGKIKSLKDLTAELDRMLATSPGTRPTVHRL